LRAEGVYTGTLSNGEQHDTIILENGQIFMMHYSLELVYGDSLIEGLGNAENGSFSSSDAKDFLFDTVIAGQHVINAVLPASISASYTADGSLNGTITEQGPTITFTGKQVDPSRYIYDAPANLADVVHDNSVQGPILSRITLDGSINIRARECFATGSIKPRASGKNVFDLQLSFSNGPICPLNGQTANAAGFVYKFVSANGTTTKLLIIVGTDASRTHRITYRLPVHP
jgi:hypothetical protein